MNRNCLFLLGFVFFIPSLKGQIVFTSNPDSTAQVGEKYMYDVEVAASPNSAAFSLEEKLTGMTINSATGLIQWTPANTSQGGLVKVKATNSAGSFYQTFYIYVTDEISCPADLLNYWKMDKKLVIGDSTIDYASHHNAYSLSPMNAVPGKLNNALEFKSLNKFQKYLYVKDVNQYDSWTRSSDFSFSLWFKHVGNYTGNDECLMARGEGDRGARFILGIDYLTQRAVFRVRTNRGLSEIDLDTISVVSNPVTNNEWHHFVAVYDGNNDTLQPVKISLYIDGVKYTNSDTFKIGYGFSMNSVQNLNIGWYSSYAAVNSYPFNGLMDEVSIFNIALDSAKVINMFNNGAPVSFCGPGNYAPLIISRPDTIAIQKSDYSYTLKVRDYDKNPIKVSVVVKPTWLTFISSTSTLTGIPPVTAKDTVVSLKISDGKAELYQNFKISVIKGNTPPVIISAQPEKTVYANKLYTYIIEASDIDVHDSLTYTAPLLPIWLNFDSSTHTLYGIPTKELIDTSETNTFNVSLLVSDQSSDTAQLNFVITVNKMPEITSIPADSAIVGTSYNYTLTVLKEDWDTVIFSPKIIPSWLNFEPETGLLSGVPTVAGQNDVTLLVTNGVDTIDQTFVITVYELSDMNEVTEGKVSNIFPVPASDKITFSFGRSSGVTIYIMDLSGKVLIRKIVPAGENKYIIDLQELSPNVYGYKIIAENELIQAGKIIKE